MATAKETPGSWWPHWLEWVSAKSGARVKAPMPGEGPLKALCDAPGEYVKSKGD
jgi:polyhydroxyalkanoate synthase